MSLHQVMEQVHQLSLLEKHQLADFLAQQIEQDALQAQAEEPAEVKLTSEQLLRMERLNWLKAHREAYAGQYVALVGTSLVGTGKTYKEARLAAKEQGVKDAFIVHISSEADTPFGGW